MSWKLLHPLIADWSDLRIKRPFLDAAGSDMHEGAMESLSFKRPDLEVATLILQELSFRKSSKAKKLMDEIKKEFIAVGHEPISWLCNARKNLCLLRYEDIPKVKYSNSLYVILRDGYTKKNGRYGVYVGQTTKKVEDRFEEHLNGEKAGRGLPKNGIQIMYSLMWPWEKIPGKKRLYYEAALHNSLKFKNIGGPVVSGDSINVEEWPKGFQEILLNKIS